MVLLEKHTFIISEFDLLIYDSLESILQSPTIILIWRPSWDLFIFLLVTCSVYFCHIRLHYLLLRYLKQPQKDLLLFLFLKRIGNKTLNIILCARVSRFSFLSDDYITMFSFGVDGLSTCGGEVDTQ